MHLQAWFSDSDGFVAGSVGFIMNVYSYMCDLRAVGRTTDAAGAGGCALSALCQRVHMTAQTGLVVAVCEACYFLF